MYSDWFYIGGGEAGSGNFGRFRAGGVRIRADYDTELISALCGRCRETSFPAGVVEDPDIPLDHGVMIPLYFIQKKYRDFRLVRIGISGLSYSDHYRLGQMIRETAGRLSRRIFFVGSGDLSHKLREEGPYGFIKEGPEYDERIMDVMGRGAFGELFDFDPNFCEKASECGHRAFIMMAGALDRTKLEIRKLSHQDTFGVGYGVCTYKALGEDPGRAFLDLWEKKEKERQKRENAVKKANKAAKDAEKAQEKAQKAAEKAAANPGDLKLQAKSQTAAAKASKALLKAEKLAKKAK
jgi:aromatic ring-opening dioxygenase LigB subunit